ncbi:hypothetical protein ACOJBO_12215 [Rhizobium beringeri]
MSPDGSEEVRRNQTTFDYIVCNQLFTKAGLRSFYNAGRPISAPVGAMEVKADWVPADEVDSADYYVSEAPDGKKYALIAMHISSKVLPNWTWTTFEHQNNQAVAIIPDAMMPMVRLSPTWTRMTPLIRPTATAQRTTH